MAIVRHGHSHVEDLSFQIQRNGKACPNMGHAWSWQSLPLVQVKILTACVSEVFSNNDQ